MIVQDLFVTARRFRLDVVTDKLEVEATEDGMPIYRAPVCQFFDPLQGLPIEKGKVAPCL